MKGKIIRIMAMMMMLIPVQRADAQIIEAVRAAIIKAIRAVDLQIQKQQNKVMWLQNAQKAMENEMSKLKLKEISDWSEKQRKLYDDYFQELKKVKNAIATYKRVRQIVEMQLQITGEYKRGWSLLKGDKHFSPAELAEMYRIYSGMLDESLKNIDQLMLVTNSFATQMSDGQRLELIESAGNYMDRNLADIRLFNQRNYKVSISRAKNQQDAEMMKKLYGID
jgi:hypothetical protein